MGGRNLRTSVVCLLALSVAAALPVLSCAAERPQEPADVVFANRTHGYNEWSTREKDPGKTAPLLAATADDFTEFGDVIETAADESSPRRKFEIRDDAGLVARFGLTRYRDATTAKRALRLGISSSYHEIAEDAGEYDIGDVCFHRAWIGIETVDGPLVPWTDVLFVRSNVLVSMTARRHASAIARRADDLVAKSLVPSSPGAGQEPGVDAFDIMQSTIHGAKEWADLVKIKGKTASEVRFTPQQLLALGARWDVDAVDGHAVSVRIVDANGNPSATITLAVFETPLEAKSWLMSRVMLSDVGLQMADDKSPAAIGDVAFYGTFVQGEGNPDAVKQRLHFIVFARNNAAAYVQEAGDTLRVAPFVDARIVESLTANVAEDTDARSAGK